MAGGDQEAEEGSSSAPQVWSFPEGKRSDVWQHFKTHPTDPRSKCSHCEKLFSSNTSTAVLKQHLLLSCSGTEHSQPGPSRHHQDHSKIVPRLSKHPTESLLKNASKEEFVLGRMIALDYIPIYKLEHSFDIREGKFNFLKSIILQGRFSQLP